MPPITTDDVQSYSIYFADLELERDIGIGTKLPQDLGPSECMVDSSVLEDGYAVGD